MVCGWRPRALQGHIGSWNDALVTIPFGSVASIDRQPGAVASDTIASLPGASLDVRDNAARCAVFMLAV